MQRVFIALLMILTVVCYGKDEQSTISQVGTITREEVLKQQEIPVLKFEVVKKYPHSTENYTEGLLMYEGVLYESTGRYGHSRLIMSDLETGKEINSFKLSERYFGEGVTILNDKAYWLTYLSNRGFIFDAKSLKQVGQFSYSTQGWGLTTDGKSLIMSDGSSSLLFVNPETFQVERELFAHMGERAIGYLNELEYVDGKIYANVFMTPLIALIDSSAGKIEGWIDLNSLVPEKLKPPLVLNGIAFRKETKHLLVTGKEWPYVYEIKLIQKSVLH